MRTFKEKILKFKENESGYKAFIFCAVFPFFLTDFILRYVLNFIVLICDFKFYVVPIIFNTLWIFGLVYLCYAVLPKTIGKIIYTIIYSFFGILFLVNYVYFRIFGQYMWLKAAFLADEGMDYLNPALEHITLPVIFLILLYISFLVITLILWQRPTYEKKYTKLYKAVTPFLLIATLLFGISVDTKVQIKKGGWEIWDRPVLVYKTFTDSNKSLNVCGYYQYVIKDIFKNMFFPTSNYNEEDAKLCDEFFQKQNSSLPNEMTGILKDKNVVFVLLESMDDWMISEKYTPTLKYLMDNGINFDNHYMANCGTGYTFNAEFAMNTGFYCPTTTSSASIFTNNNYPYALANLFKNSNYNTNSFHFNGENFYNRKVMHKLFGYNSYYRLSDYIPFHKAVQDSETPKNDTVYDLMTQEKFFDFFISYSCHFPYDTYDHKLKGALEKYPELIDESIDTEVMNLFLLAHDTDQFFANLIERLKSDGLYENTVIIGVTDHYAYGLKNKEALKQYSDAAGYEIMEKVPFFIYSPSLEPKRIEKVTSAIDILPTISNMFGLDDKGYHMGSDAFDPEYNGFVYFPNGTWYDGTIYYTADPSVTYTAEQLEYIKNMNEKIHNMKRVNDYTIESNYMKGK